MFKEIEAMMGEQTLCVSLVVAKNKDGLAVTVLPKVKEGVDTTLSTPLALQGTAEELDAEFINLLSRYSGSRKSLSEQYAETDALMAAAKEASAKKGQDALKKGVKPTTGKAVAPVCGATCDEGDEDDGSTAVTPSAPAQTPASVPSLFAD